MVLSMHKLMTYLVDTN